MGRLFGTDGIRGVANEALTSELATKVGRAVATVLMTGTTKRPKVLIGKDTRISGGMIGSALSAGLCALGVDVHILGTVPTPAVAVLVKKYGADAGIMISASHNPYQDNGIKIFNSEGYKLADELEERIEDIILGDTETTQVATYDSIGAIKFNKTAIRDYIDHVKSTTTGNLEGLNIAIDCANGASSATAQTLFEELGATCHMLYNKPNGVNINDNCGSTHMDNLRNYVIENNLDAGLAFDGDADRFLCVDNNGNYLDGDEIMAICAMRMKEKGTLSKNTLVGTIMSNLGLVKLCEKSRIVFASTKVGDRYVLEKMLLDDLNLGGEQSGHLIFRDYCTTGDGQLAAIQLLTIMKELGAKLSDLHTVMKKFPQSLVNVRISAEGKLAFYNNINVRNALAKATEELGSTGRIVVRPSGTEPLLRVMVEAEQEEMLQKISDDVVAVIKAELC